MIGFHERLMPALRLLPPETAHRIAVSAVRWGLGPRNRVPDPGILSTSVWGLDFRNPVGLAAGFDKGAKVPDAMMAAGFGFAEAGTVTPLPQPGNAGPRLFRLSADHAVINRLGFNSAGLEPFVRRIARRGRGRGPFGANIGRNKDSLNEVVDYEACIEAVSRHVDFIVLNVSSPNTPGLRAMQRTDTLSPLLRRALAARARAVSETPPPLIVKIAPDLSGDDLDELADVVLDAGIDGMTVVNTTTARPSHMTDPLRAEAGGLSGAPLFPMALDAVGRVYRRTRGCIPIIGSGGISTGEEAYAMIRAGASLVQFYTAMIFKGPGLVQRIKSDLAACLRRDGFASVADAVGAGVTVDLPATKSRPRPVQAAARTGIVSPESRRPRAEAFAARRNAMTAFTVLRHPDSRVRP